MKKIIARMVHYQEYLSLKALELSFFILITWTFLFSNSKDALPNIAVGYTAILLVALSALFAIVVMERKRSRPRMPDVSYAIYRDWMITPRFQKLMIIHMFLLGFYSIQHLIIFGIKNDFHSFAIFSGSISFFVWWRSLPCKTKSDLMFSEIQNELKEAGYFRGSISM